METSGGGNLEKPIVFGEALTLEKNGVNCQGLQFIQILAESLFLLVQC